MICPKYMYVSQRTRITEHLNNNKNLASQTNMFKFNWRMGTCNENPVICKKCFLLHSMAANYAIRNGIWSKFELIKDILSLFPASIKRVDT